MYWQVWMSQGLRFSTTLIRLCPCLYVSRIVSITTFYHRIRIERAGERKRFWSELNNSNTEEIDHMFQWGANRNPWAGYRMSSYRSQRTPNRVVINGRPQIEHIMRGRRAAWSPLWWWPCYSINHVAYFAYCHQFMGVLALILTNKTVKLMLILQK